MRRRSSLPRSLAACPTYTWMSAEKGVCTPGAHTLVQETERGVGVYDTDCPTNGHKSEEREGGAGFTGHLTSHAAPPGRERLLL